VGDAVVGLTSGVDTYTVTSASQPADAVGSYLVAGVKPGTYTLSASLPGTSPTTVIVTVTAGQNLAFNPVLIPPASIAGTVTDRSGAALGGVEVILFRASRYRFADVDAPQAYVVEVRSPTTGALGSATLVLAASEAAVLDITVGPQVQTSTASPSTSPPAPPPPNETPPPADTPPAEPPVTPPDTGSGP
jgi:hypothetical protein